MASMNDTSLRQIDLQAAAKQTMLENGFEPDFPAQVQQQLDALKSHLPQIAPDASIRDLRNLLWSSIDNDTSRDLDQVEVAERLPSGETKVLVGIADVDAFVPKDSAPRIDLAFRGVAAKCASAMRKDAQRSSSLVGPESWPWRRLNRLKLLG